MIVVEDKLSSLLRAFSSEDSQESSTLSENSITRLEELRSQGSHAQCLAELGKWKLPAQLQAFVMGRLEAELGNRKRAARLFHKAILNPDLTDYCTRELFYLNFKTDRPREMIKTFYSLFAHVFAQDSYVNSSASFEELDVHVLSDLTHQIMSGLEDRHLLKEKLEFLYSLRDEESLWSHGLMLEYEDLNERVHQDLYYSYYGFVTMLFQFALATSLVLITLLYTYQYYGAYFFEVSLVLANAQIHNVEGFQESVQRLTKVALIIVALAPLIFLNFKMIMAKISGNLDCYCEDHGDYLKIVHFSKVFQFPLGETDKNTYLYTDDSDFNYIGLIRHFPLVPNLTYIYAYDMVRGAYFNVPLYGVADARIYIDSVLSKRGMKVYPLNMVGVRLTQLFSVMNLIPSLARWVLLLCSYLIYAQFDGLYFLASNSQKFVYVLHGLCFTTLFFYKEIQQLGRWLLRSRYLGFPLRIPVLRYGLTLLAIWIFFQHYRLYTQYFWFAALLSSLMFYLVFVSTRREGITKQLAAEIGSMEQTGRNLVGIKSVALGHLREGLPLKSYLYKGYLCIRSRLLGMDVYLETLSNKEKIRLSSKFGHTVIHLNDGVVSLIEPLGEVRARLAEYGFEVEEVQKGSFSNIHKKFSIFSCCFILWLAWQGYAEREVNRFESLELEEYTLNRMDIFNKFQAEFRINDRFEVIHLHEDLKWDLSLDSQTGELVFSQSRLPTWGEVERTLRANYDPAIFESKKIPPFLKPDGFRDNSVEFLTWWLLRKHIQLDWKTQKGFVSEYCSLQGFGYEKQRCAFRIEKGFIHGLINHSEEFLQALIQSEESIGSLIFHEKGRRILLKLFGDKDPRWEKWIDQYPSALRDLPKTLRKSRYRRIAGVNHINTVGMTFRKLPSTSFQMGWNQRDSDLYTPQKDEMPVHEVRLSHRIYIQTTEVTQAQWRAVMGSNPSFQSDCDDCPVENVSYRDANNFLDNLNGLEGCSLSQSEIFRELEAGNGDKIKDCYRLPTEAEWEFACLGGRRAPFGHGNTTHELFKYAWFQFGGGWGAGGGNKAVGTRAPNTYKLYDLSGNVEEWVYDGYQSDYYKKSPSENPLGPKSSEANPRRVVRGGHISVTYRDHRCAKRKYHRETKKSIEVGFRVVKSR